MTSTPPANSLIDTTSRGRSVRTRINQSAISLDRLAQFQIKLTQLLTFGEIIKQQMTNDPHSIRDNELEAFVLALSDAIDVLLNR